MYFAMNRFKVRLESEADFEAVWKDRDSRLSEMKGFRKFHLLRGAASEEEGYRLYVSHSEWNSHEDFVAWTKSENFRAAHQKAGNNKPLYMGPPQFEGFSTVESA